MAKQRKSAAKITEKQINGAIQVLNELLKIADMAKRADMKQSKRSSLK